MPITPKEVRKNKLTVIPPQVFAVVDRLITVSYTHGSAKVSQEKILDALVMQGFDSSEVFDKGWLDFESCYEDAGWKVVYDKPGFSETYPATFTFTPKN